MCSGGDLNPHALRHTPLKRTCLPFHHPSFLGCEDYSFNMPPDERKRSFAAVSHSASIWCWRVPCFHSCKPVNTASTILPVTAFSTGAAQAAAPTRWVKADLHVHTAEDPFDEIDYTASELLDRAHQAGFRVLAITLHDKVFDVPEIFAKARGLGILLISAAELRIEGADAVLLNLSVDEAAGIKNFEDLRRLRTRRGPSLLVFVPHPFYRFGGSIGHRLEQYLDCFDAIEHCHFHVPLFNPNAPAARLAARTNKPLLATSDAHRLRFFGEHYSRLALARDAQPPELDDVFEAIRAHRIERVSPAGGFSRFFALMVFLFLIHPILTRMPGSKRMQARRLLAASEAPKPSAGRRAAA